MNNSSFRRGFNDACNQYSTTTTNISNNQPELNIKVNLWTDDYNPTLNKQSRKYSFVCVFDTYNNHRFLYR